MGNLPGPLVLLNNCLGGDCFILNNIEKSADFIDAYNYKEILKISGRLLWAVPESPRLQLHLSGTSSSSACPWKHH